MEITSTFEEKLRKNKELLKEVKKRNKELQEDIEKRIKGIIYGKYVI